MNRWLLCGFIVVSLAGDVTATSFEPIPVVAAVKRASAIGRCEVVNLQVARDPAGAIRTYATLQVLETIKGTLPPQIVLNYPGGKLGIENAYHDFSPEFAAGGEYLVFFDLQADGSLSIFNGPRGAIRLDLPAGRAEKVQARAKQMLSEVRQSTGGRRITGANFQRFAPISTAPVSGQSVSTGSWQAASVTADGGSGFTEVGGVPRRHTAPDRGETIKVLVDTDFLPPGITQPQALQALQNALDAWETASSVRFEIEGTVSFGQAAINVDLNDGRLRIQMHDAYNLIPNSNTTLGIGGGVFRSGFVAQDPLPGRGGRVFAKEFDETIRSYVVLDHEKATLATLGFFEQVLCHEIGHALGLAHSSENNAEPNPLFSEAMMYFKLISPSTRGAALGTYDGPKLQESHPISNTPPFSPNRVFEIVTAAPAGQAILNNLPRINRVTLQGGDLQSDSQTLNLQLITQTGENEFVLQGNVLRCLPTSFSQAPRLSDSEIEEGVIFSQALLRYSDGIHASPIFSVSSVALWASQHPAQATPNGLPGDWASPFFGVQNPNPNLDPDGDGFTTMDEFLFGTNPVNAESKLQITNFDGSVLQWAARPFDAYILETSVALGVWNPIGFLRVPTFGNPSVNLPTAFGNRNFYRVRRLE